MADKWRFHSFYSQQWFMQETKFYALRLLHTQGIRQMEKMYSSKMTTSTYHILLPSPRTKYVRFLHYVRQLGRHLPQEAEENKNRSQNYTCCDRDSKWVRPEEKSGCYRFSHLPSVLHKGSFSTVSTHERRLAKVVSQKYFGTVTPTDFN